MAHCGQHGNSEAKKPKKEKSKGVVPVQSPKWAGTQNGEGQTGSKH
jgi:hypothetical protein